MLKLLSIFLKKPNWQLYVCLLGQVALLRAADADALSAPTSTRSKASRKSKKAPECGGAK